MPKNNSKTPAYQRGGTFSFTDPTAGKDYSIMGQRPDLQRFTGDYSTSSGIQDMRINLPSMPSGSGVSTSVDGTTITGGTDYRTEAQKVRQAKRAERVEARQTLRNKKQAARIEKRTKKFEDPEGYKADKKAAREQKRKDKENNSDGSPNKLLGNAMANINNVMGQPQAFSYDVPMQANMIGTAKPVFNQQTMGMAEAAFGNPAMRQAAVGSAFQMKPIPEGDEGKGLRALPDNVVEKMGYDSATKMLSPLKQRGKTVLGIEYSLSPELYRDSLQRAKKEQKFNESMKPKPTKTLINKHDINPKFAPPNNTNVQNNKKELFKKNK